MDFFCQVLPGKPPLQPNPQIRQHDTRSSEENLTLTSPSDWMHTLSDIASTAPNAWKPFKHYSVACLHRMLSKTNSSYEENRTQQEPQDPWSLISWIVGQLGHCVLESNSSGMFTAPSLCSRIGNVNFTESGWTPISNLIYPKSMSSWKLLPAWNTKRDETGKG